jgi:histidinol dehydrogenase
MIDVERIEKLSLKRRNQIMDRSMPDLTDVFPRVRKILDNIKKHGDAESLKEHRQFKKNISVADLKAKEAEIKAAYDKVDKDVIQALKKAAKNIRTFHQAQLERDMWTTEVDSGIIAGRITRPLDIVGAYVPGGRASYPSSVLMNVIPAKVAGVDNVVMATPPAKNMKVPPVTLVAADIAGADEIYKIGGPWAVGSMAYGTQTVPKVDKIVGPGSKWVTAAKMLVFGAVDIDSPAGPSEGLILADETANVDWIVWDFFSQLEHDPDAASILVTTSQSLAENMVAKIKEIFPNVPRKEIVQESLKANAAILVAKNMDEAIQFSNDYAPEHLQIITQDPWAVLPRIRHAGSIFMGPYAPIPCGDYASGTNHVLPTGRAARMFSGLSVDDFIKKSTFQYLTKDGLKKLSKTVITLAESEGLPIHAETVRRRFK